MSAALKTPAPMLVADFLTWDAPGPETWQLVDGQPQAMAPANRTHGALQAELAGLIRNALRAAASPCSVIVEPGIVPRFLAAHNVRIPDLAVTCTPYQTEEPTLSDPVLLVEILSPSNQAETWANVWAYTSIPSVREILVLHTTEIRADLLRRSQDGAWPAEPATILEGQLDLETVGLRVRVEQIYVTTRLARTA
jgi:Uma2 family endonuclease